MDNQSTNKPNEVKINACQVNYLNLIILFFLNLWGYLPKHNLHVLKYLLYHILAVAKYIEKHGQIPCIQKTLNMLCYDEDSLQMLKDEDFECFRRAKSLAEDFETERFDNDSNFSEICCNLFNGYSIALKSTPSFQGIDYSTLIAFADEFNKLSQDNEELKEQHITTLAKSMISISENRIYIRYKDAEGTIGHWCCLDEFFDEIVYNTIMDDPENGPTITVNGTPYINWIALLLERQQGKSKFKYKIDEEHYLYFWY